MGDDHKTSMFMFLLFWAAGGFLVPLAVLAVDWFSEHGWFPGWILLIWPSSVLLFPHSGYSMDIGKLAVIGLSAALNAVLYVIVGYLLYRVVHLVKS